MSRSHGVRPWPSQRHLPEEQITEWEIDSKSELDEQGRPLRRLRRKVTGTKAKALAQRRAWLCTLTADGGKPAPTPAPPSKPVAAHPTPGKRGRKTETPMSTTTLRSYYEGPYSKHSEEALAPATLDTRDRIYRTIILPILGHLPLDEVNKPRSHVLLREELDRRANQALGRTGKLSVSYKNAVLVGLSAVLSHAGEGRFQPDGEPLIEKMKIRLYRMKSREFRTEGGIRCGFLRGKRYPEEECHDLISSCESDYEMVVVGLGLFTGCRISEACARRWDDIDWKTKRLVIDSTVCSKTHRIKDVKNGVSREVSMAPTLLGPLERLRAEARGDYILGGDVLGRRPFLLRPSLSFRFERVCARAETVRQSYHALRHTFCSRLADKGLPVHLIQMAAGHTSPSTTFGYISSSAAEADRVGELSEL